jgi:hypothetical protein
MEEGLKVFNGVEIVELLDDEQELSYPSRDLER